MEVLTGLKCLEINIEDHCEQIGAGYLFDTNFQTAYLERGADCYVDFLDECTCPPQVKRDASATWHDTQRLLMWYGTQNLDGK
jgi:hypothetical protein